MTNTASRPVALLLETPQGDTVGVKFSNRDAARDFEDHHGLSAVGCVDLITQTEAALRGLLA